MASRRFVNNMMSVFDLEIAETANSTGGFLQEWYSNTIEGQDFGASGF